MKYRGIHFKLCSPLIGVHLGRNPVSGERFLHIAPFPFISIEFSERDTEPQRDIPIGYFEGKPYYDAMPKMVVGRSTMSVGVGEDVIVRLEPMRNPNEMIEGYNG